MEENKSKEVLYAVKEFFGDDFDAIKAEVIVTKYMEEGLMRWVSTDGCVRISDGSKIIDLDIDLWDKEVRATALNKLKTITRILNEVLSVVEPLLPELDKLEDEAKANREILEAKYITKDTAIL